MKQGEAKKKDSSAHSSFSIHHSPGQLKVALVCDWLVGTGGAERVALELHRLYPEAPIYTSQYDPRLKTWFGDKFFKEADIRTLWTQKLPKALRKFLPPLRAWAFSRLDLNEYDLVISSSGAEAKFVKAKPSAVHITYCHAPTHYYWGRYEQYLKQPGFGFFDPLARLGLRALVGPMRKWDYKAAQRPDYLIANSRYTQSEIKKYYGRDCVVIHPPVDVEHFAAHNQPAAERHGFITAGRQTPYKRIDLAVKAASQAGVPLLVIGRGPDHKKLVRIAGPTVTFLTEVSDEKMPHYFGGAKGFILPGIDDFGIVAVEAMAAGTPLLAFGRGGVLDYIDKDTGIVFNKASAEALSEAMGQFVKINFNHDKITRQAKQFSADRFRSEMMRFIKQSVK